MRDLLSFLFKAKSEFLSKECDLEEFLSGSELQPLVDVVAAAKGITNRALVASALCEYLQKNVEIIKANTLIANVSVEKGTSGNMKSGKLDKVSDDCLCTVLQFLDFRDRCNAVERVCHRLFQLSRAVPIHCHRFDEVWYEDIEEEMDVSRLVRRFGTCEILSFDSDSKWESGFVTEPMAISLMAHFRDTVKELRVGNEYGTQPVLNATFPNLSRLRVVNSVPLLCQTLANNSTVSEVSLSDEDDVIDWHLDGASFFTTISEFKNLRKIRIEGNLLRHSADLKKPPDIDLTHVTHLHILGELDFLPHFAHGNLQEFRLEACNKRSLDWFCAERKSVTLKKWVVDCSDKELFDAFRYSKVETLEINNALDYFLQASNCFKPRHLKYIVEDNFMISETQNQLQNLVTSVAANCFRCQSLELVFAESDDAEYVKVAREFLARLSQVLLLSEVSVVIQLTIAKSLWAKVAAVLKPSQIERLQNKCDLNLCNYHSVLSTCVIM